MEEKELKEWLIETKVELKKLEISADTVYYGLIQGSILMIDIVIKKMETKLNH